MIIESYVTSIDDNGTALATLGDRFEITRDSRSDDDVSDDNRRAALAIILALALLILVALAPIAMWIAKRRAAAAYQQIQ